MNGVQRASEAPKNRPYYKTIPRATIFLLRMGTKVFISWSGERSKLIAEAVNDLLQKTIPVLEPWMSSEDINKGAVWANELARTLKSTPIGIVCLTPENLKSAWILFEAGALYRAIETSHVCPLLYQVEQHQLEGPLQQFQSSTLAKDDVRRMLRTIKSVLGSRPPEWTFIQSAFDEWQWPRFEDKIKRINVMAPAASEPLQSLPTQLRDLLANPSLELMELLKKAAPASIQVGQEFPSDYYFLNHASFLRKDKQEEFIKRTGVFAPHYDIRVIVDSNYEGALERIDKVEYTLHPNYPKRSYVVTDRRQKFLLKELANGESIIRAHVHVSGSADPVLLQRYMTLWETGPRLP